MTKLREGVSCDYRRWCCSLTETDAPGLPISGPFELARPNGRSWRIAENHDPVPGGPVSGLVRPFFASLARE